MEILLNELESGKTGEISRIKGGRGFKRRLRTRGIREGMLITLITSQPGGPIVVQVSGTQISMGRGMARKVVVEV